MRCLIAFDSKGFPLQKCIEKLGQLRQGSLNYPDGGNQTSSNCMVILRDSPYNNELFGLVIS